MKKKLIVPIVAAAVVVAGITAMSSPASASTTTHDRISGADRYATAVSVAQQLYPSHADTVWIASGENFPDALSAGPAATMENAPLLLTAHSSLPASVATYIRALNPTKVVIVGGTGAVSAAVGTQVWQATGVTPNRISGTDRYQTSEKIATTVWGANSLAGQPVWFASGAAFPDALAAAAAAGDARVPVILVPPTGSVQAQAQDAQSLGATDFKIAGGTGAVSSQVQSSIAAYLGGTAQRFGGSDRYSTANMIAATYGAVPGIIYIASGMNFPDALVGARLAAGTDRRLYLSAPSYLPASVYAATNGSDVTGDVVIGGTGALSNNVENLLAAPTPPTGSETSALATAKQYFQYGFHFSYQGLIDQLSSPYGDKYSVADATYAADHVGVNWNTEAVGAANSYKSAGMHFSVQGLIDQLSSAYGDQFTVAQATYAANVVGAF
ncbi:cell wall-binding repeat-containing protein [Diaminobutyricibacter sp. McL0608]|uniref:cell wall-binding repeat-containing protein n=1 Tax=Leifsonia sp. McL0608 TaxID=3143537 RepID=UPI0031F2DEDD